MNVYQVPVKNGDGPIRKNFERTVLEGIHSDDLHGIYDPPIDHEILRVWGNQENEAADVGDYLLFANRKGRRDGSYTHLARISHSTILDQDTAKRFTEAVGWGDGIDEVFPHVMFLEPVYKTDLERSSFWDLLGFKGWPNDTYSGIKFDRSGSRFHSEYSSVGEFVDDIKAKKIYPADSIREYETLEETLTDIGDKLDLSEKEDAWLKNRIGDRIIEDWSTALSGFQPSDEISSGRAIKLDQLRTVCRSLEPELEKKAEEFNIGSLDGFSPAETLFLGGVRLIQDGIDIDGGVLNQPRLNSILKESYTTSEEGISKASLSTDHYLTSYIREIGPSTYTLSAPPDYWLTAVKYAAVGFSEANRDLFEQLEEGDVAVLHSQTDPVDDELKGRSNGVIGVGIVGKSFNKEQIWWREEYDQNTNFPLAISFEQLFLTGKTDEISFDPLVNKEERSVIDKEIDSLVHQSISSEQITTASSQEECPVSSEFHTLYLSGRKISDEHSQSILESITDNLTEVSTVNVHEQFQGSIPKDVLDGLYFVDEKGDQILEQIETALRSGKHVLLTGPPGTGKTEIAERVCKRLSETHPYLYSGFGMTTATADWSTFDTVGGYMPNESNEADENLSFTPGIVLNRLKNKKTGMQSNELTIIDELNRADIDKAFGQLFTLLSGQSIQLPYTISGNEVELKTYDDTNGAPSTNQYIVPNSWRIFATMNAYDKTSLYEMSYAFMRRFAFIRVPAPKIPEQTERDGLEDNIVFDYAAAWDIDISPREAQAVERVWRKANTAVDGRALGPAIIEDVLRYVTQHPDDDIKYHLTQAVISYIFPQLEGVPKRKAIVREIKSVSDIDTALIESAATEMLQITFQQE